MPIGYRKEKRWWSYYLALSLKEEEYFPAFILFGEMDEEEKNDDDVCKCVVYMFPFIYTMKRQVSELSEIKMKGWIKRYE